MGRFYLLIILLDFKVARIFDHRLLLLSVEIANSCRINFDVACIKSKIVNEYFAIKA